MSSKTMRMKTTSTFFDDLDLIVGFYTILVVSLVMTVFEIFFYYFIVFQDSRNAVRKAVADAVNIAPYIGEISGSFVASDSNASSFLTTYNPIELVIRRISIAFWTLGVQEAEMITESNTAHILLGATLIPLLVLLVLVVNRKMRKMAVAKGPGVYKTKMKVIGLSVLVTVLMLVPFQYLFYLFGSDFYFTGREGIEEVENALYTSLRKQLGMPAVVPVVPEII